jgi:hypothetical protein
MTSDWRRRLAEIVEEVGEDAVLEALNAPTSEEMAAFRQELVESAAWRRRIDQELADLRRPPEAPPEHVRVIEAMIARNRAHWRHVLEMQEARTRGQKNAAHARRMAILGIANKANAPRGRDLTKYVCAVLERREAGCSARTVRRHLKAAKGAGELRR